jgi:hypothetical protein
MVFVGVARTGMASNRIKERYFIVKAVFVF